MIFLQDSDNLGLDLHMTLAPLFFLTAWKLAEAWLFFPLKGSIPLFKVILVYLFYHDYIN